MIVEDEFLIASDLQHTFEDLGWRVIGPASTVDKAMRLLDLELPLIALLDINVGSDPVTPVAQCLKQHDIPFAFASGSADASILCAKLGAVTAISKPFNKIQLRSVVNKMVSLAVIEAG